MQDPIGRAGRTPLCLALAAVVACGSGESIPSGPTPAISIGLLGSPVSIVAGQTAAVTVTLARSGAFTGPVELSADAPAAGLTATFSPSTLAAGVTSATLTIGAARAMTPGFFSLVVQARAAGVSGVVAIVPFAVTAPVKNLALHFCAPNWPDWIATQDGAGEWIQATPDADSVFRVSISARGGVATAYDGDDTLVTYGTTEELAVLYAACTRGSKTLHGTVTTVGDSSDATVYVGGAFTMTGDGAFDLTGVPDGPQDLVAVKGRSSLADFSRSAQRMIVRRSLNLPNNGGIQLSFGAPESVNAASAQWTVPGAADGTWSWTSYFHSAGGTRALMSYGSASGHGGAPTASYFGAPQSLTTANDAQELIVGGPDVGPVSRSVDVFFRDVVDRQIELGPALNMPTVSLLSTAARWHVTLPVQPEYGSYAVADFWQQGTLETERLALLVVTSGYLGGTPATWDIAFPDLSGAGFDPVWGLRAGQTPTWMVGAVGGGSLVQFANPTAGLTLRRSDRFSPGQSVASSGARRRRHSPRLDVLVARNGR